MKTKYIAPSEVAIEIASAVTRLARDIELRGTKEERQASVETRIEGLMSMLEHWEITALVRLIVEPRVECARCKRGVPVSRASGAYCLACDVVVREAHMA